MPVNLYEYSVKNMVVLHMLHQKNSQNTHITSLMSDFHSFFKFLFLQLSAQPVFFLISVKKSTRQFSYAL